VSEQKPIEVAIVGGGCAGITAAFELTRSEHKGKYHVMVYQRGADEVFFRALSNSL
jgi:thioredoxin reductase